MVIRTSIPIPEQMGFVDLVWAMERWILVMMGVEESAGDQRERDTYRVA